MEERVYLLLAVAQAKEDLRKDVVREVVEDAGDLRRAYDDLRRSAAAGRTGAGDRSTVRLSVTVNPRNVLDAYFAFRERMNGRVRDRPCGDGAALRKFKRADSYWRSELQRPGARRDAPAVRPRRRRRRRLRDPLRRALRADRDPDVDGDARRLSRRHRAVRLHRLRGRHRVRGEDRRVAVRRVPRRRGRGERSVTLQFGVATSAVVGSEPDGDLTAPIWFGYARSHRRHPAVGSGSRPRRPPRASGHRPRRLTSMPRTLIMSRL